MLFLLREYVCQGWRASHLLACVEAVGAAAEASPDEAPSPELNRALDNPQETFAYWLDYAVVGALIFDMIIKPFGF